MPSSETEPLVSPVEQHPVWKFWKRRDLEDDYPESDKRRRRRQWERYMSYLALVVAGTLVGAVLMRHWDQREKTTLGDGPMVPPVFTLPPVSDASTSLTIAHRSSS
jgi:hypothetical protein